MRQDYRPYGLCPGSSQSMVQCNITMEAHMPAQNPVLSFIQRRAAVFWLVYVIPAALFAVVILAS